MSFNKGDKVKVKTKNSIHGGKVGEILYSFEDEKTCTVQFDSGDISGFFLTELELVDEKREALIGLAETLDKARLQANAIDTLPIASQRGVYGQIVLALHDTLEQIVGDTEDPSLDADKVYVSMFADGNTVREALVWWAGKR